MTTKFKLMAADGGTVNIAEFGQFDDNPEKGRVLARAHIEYCREHWRSYFPASETLRIVEE